MAFKQKAALEHGKNTCLRGKGSHCKQEMLVNASAITFLPTSSCSDWTICHLKHIAEKEANEGGTAQGKPNQKGCKWLPYTERADAPGVCSCVLCGILGCEPLHLPVLRKAPADLKPKRVCNGDFAINISTAPLTHTSLSFLYWLSV